MTKCVADMHVGTIQSAMECCRIQEYNTQCKGTILLEPRTVGTGNGIIGGTVESKALPLGLIFANFKCIFFLFILL